QGREHDADRVRRCAEMRVDHVNDPTAVGLRGTQSGPQSIPHMAAVTGDDRFGPVGAVRRGADEVGGGLIRQGLPIKERQPRRLVRLDRRQRLPVALGETAKEHGGPLPMDALIRRPEDRHRAAAVMLEQQRSIVQARQARIVEVMVVIAIDHFGDAPGASIIRGPRQLDPKAAVVSQLQHRNEMPRFTGADGVSQVHAGVERKPGRGNGRDLLCARRLGTDDDTGENQTGYPEAFAGWHRMNPRWAHTMAPVDNVSIDGRKMNTVAWATNNAAATL